MALGICAEPSPRYSHFSTLVEGELYVWGGQVDFCVEEDNALKQLISHIHHFDIMLESWTTTECSGVPDPPPGLGNGGCASSGHHIYFYGGYNESGLQNSLHQLDTKSWRWKQLCAGGGPMRKAGCGMVACDSRLVLFGGYGVLSSPAQEQLGADFIEDMYSKARYSKKGWTNELHSFDLKEGESINFLELKC